VTLVVAPVPGHLGGDLRAGLAEAVGLTHRDTGSPSPRHQPRGDRRAPDQGAAEGRRVAQAGVAATFLVAAVSLVLGLYMNSRDDGIALLSTLVNFGALFAFLLLHVSVVVHYVVRHKSRDWWRHLVVPVIGFAILLYVLINAKLAAQTTGFVWLVVGLGILTFLMVTGREPELAGEVDA